MNKKGPIIIVEDDPDDLFTLEIAFQELNLSNAVVMFSNANDALEYLRQHDCTPSLIISDINMPKIDGFEFRSLVCSDQRLRDKSIPFLFFSTTSNKKHIEKAEALSAEGLFVKPNTYTELLEGLKGIVGKWSA